MVVGDLIYIEMPDDYEIDFLHLGLIYCLDSDKDGRFSQDDIDDFSIEAMKKIAQLKKDNLSHEIKAQMKAWCT